MESNRFGMMNSEALFQRLESSAPLTGAELSAVLSLEEPCDLDRLFRLAYEVKTRSVGRLVRFRGLVEVGNVCVKDCLYCGIRKSNRNVRRYSMPRGEILSLVEAARKARFGSVVLQGGERSDPAFVDEIEAILREIRRRSGGALGVTLSLGEQSSDTLRRWRDAGATRYLLRVETTSPELYAKIHPPETTLADRIAALKRIQDAGYQTGTGVMIGLPGQTIRNLVDDLLFFRDFDIDMIGMGPYLPHPDTPLTQANPGFPPDSERQLLLGLKMIAACRLLIPDANIASTTALHALAPDGRERGLLAGANVVMPNLDAPEYKREYNLYAGKPNLDDGMEECLSSLVDRIAAIGESVAWDSPGDPIHFYTRIARAR